MNVSVVIPVYNAEKFVARTIGSVLSQTYRDFEIVVVDDGSTDNSVEEVLKFNDHRIRLIRKPNGGVSSARNIGVKNARGKWIAFIDADDEWKPDKLKLQMDCIECHPDIKWCICLFSVYLNGVLLRNVCAPSSKLFSSENVIRDVLELVANAQPVHTITVLALKSEIEKAGLFDEHLKVGEDIDLWLRIAINNPQACFIRQHLANYHFANEQSLTSTTDRDKLSKIDYCLEKMSEYQNRLTRNRIKYLKSYMSLIVTKRAKMYLKAGESKNAKNFIMTHKSKCFGLPLFFVFLLSLLPGKLILGSYTLKKLFTKRRISVS